MPRTAQQQRGAATRARIVEAATYLFRRDGYLTTTVDAIAREAGVAVQTLYLGFGSKVAILSAAHDVALVGDAEPVPLLERAWVRRLSDASAETALTQTLEHLRESTERVAGVYSVIQTAAADPAVADLLAKLQRQRIESCRALADLLVAAPGANPNASRDRLADVLYAMLGVESYELLVTQRGWPAGDWQQWAHDVLALQLLGP